MSFSKFNSFFFLFIAVFPNPGPRVYWSGETSKTAGGGAKDQDWETPLFLFFLFCFVLFFQT